MAIYGVNSYSNINIYNQIYKNKNTGESEKALNVSNDSKIGQDRNADVQKIFDNSEVDELIKDIPSSEESTSGVDVAKIRKDHIDKSRVQFDSNAFTRENINPININDNINKIKANDLIGKYKIDVRSPYMNGQEKSMSMVL